MDSAKSQLESLWRFFILRYREEARRRHPLFHSDFPLVNGSRLDLVQINGGSKVHFFYRRGAVDEHLVVIHDLTLDLGTSSQREEQQFVAQALQLTDILVHFALEPPFHEKFDRVEKEALVAVSDHDRFQK